MGKWRERLKNRYVGLTGVVLGGLIVIALLVWLVPHNSNAVQETGQKGKDTVKYVLVNNDNGATFNNRSYNLGTDFVTLIEQDTKRDWSTASADEAEAGVENGTYDVVITIPSNFSNQLLNLNSTNPTKAGIKYKVRKGQNEVTNQQISAQVTKLVTYFNNRVVRMYFASLIQNLRNAQLAVAGQANVRSNEVANLTNGVQSPFSGLSDQYNSIFNTASTLGASNQADLETIKSFSGQVQRGLTNLGESVTQAQTNSTDQLENLANQVANLTTSSQEFQNQFEFNTYPDNLLQAAISTRSNSGDELRDNLSSLVNALDADKSTLENLSNSLAGAYGLNAGNSVGQNIKLIQTNSNNGSLEAQLAQLIQTQVEGLPVYSAKPDGISDNVWSDYTRAKEILTAYNDLAGTTFGQSQNQTNTQTGNVAGQKYLVTLTRPANIPSGQATTIKFSSPDGVDVDIAAADLNSTNTTSDAATIDNSTKIVTFPANNDIEAVTLTVSYSGRGSYTWSWNDQRENTGTVGITANTGMTEAINRDIQATINTAKLVSQRYTGNSNLASYQSEINQIKENFNKANVKTTGSISTGSAKRIAQAYADIQSQLSRISSLQNERNYQNLVDDGRDRYASEVSNILQWYLSAQQAVNAGTATTTATKETSDNSLADQYQSLQDGITQQAAGLGQNTTEQGLSLANTVNDLTGTTNRLKNTTDGIRSTLNDNVSNARQSARGNQTFADNFNRVMQNARNGENQNAQVYNFLSNPLTADGQFSTARQTAILPFFMTVIGTLAATVVGLAINRFLPGRRLTKTTALIKHTRVWLNLPSVGITLIAGLILGIALGVGTGSLAGRSDPITWTIYASLIMITLTSLVMMIARYSRMVAVIVMGIIGSLFVMLSPFLGMLTRSGSIIRFLYQWSPLQNIQTGYSALYNGGIIGAATILGLLLLICFTTIGSLLIRPLPTQVTTEDQLTGGNDVEDDDE